MASGVKKLQINVDVQAAFSSALKQADNFKKKLSSLSLPKTITKDLEKDLADYQKNLQKILNFKPTTNNLGEYRNLISQLNDSFKQLSVSINNLESNTEEAFSKNPKIENYKQQIENLKKEIQALDKATKSYYGVTSSDSKAKQDAARKEKQELTAGLTGAAAESTAKKQEQMTAALKESAKAKEKLIKLEAQLEEATIENNKAQQQAVTAAKTVSNAYQNVSPPIKEATNSLNQWENQAEQIRSQNMYQTLNNTLSRWTAIGIAVNFAREQLVKMKDTYLDLDANLTQIAVVSGRTRDEMWDMIGTYNEMARRLGATTSQVVESSKLYFQQGRSQSEVMELVEQTTILATISELDFADATNYLTAAINGFKLEADDASNITDVWANLAAKAAVDTNELAVAISKVASIAKSAGADIETTSAFLTKMIETTREAPENLGTALKTIIARFQELKDSTEALEDGVDANKVEKALKQADVALRDSTGQFRDFDDVIMELSSKWDGLDRNTQRYIATIAAGARQQSRFIALVEDYDRNVELVNMAQNSAGASAAQFSTQLTGLEASMNRLQASWEGLYTSFNVSNIFSGIIDILADITQSFADLGIVGTSLFAALGFAAIKFGIKVVAMNPAIIKSNGLMAVSVSTIGTAYKVAGIEALNAGKKFLVVAGSALTTLLPLVVAIGAIIYVIDKVNKYIHRHEIALREAKEALQEYQGALGQAQQEITTYQSLQNELDETYKKGESLIEIRKKIIEQAPEVADMVDVETASYEELTKAIQKYLKEKQEEAAINAINVAKEQKTIAEEELETLPKIQETGKRQTVYYPSGRVEFLPVEWSYNGKIYDDYEEALQARQQDIEEANRKIEQYSKVSFSNIKIISSNIINELGIEGNPEAEKIVSLMLYGASPEDFENGTYIGDKIAELSKDNILGIQKKVSNFITDSPAPETLESAWQKFLIGDSSELSSDIVKQFEEAGVKLKELAPELIEEYQNRRVELANELKNFGIEGQDYQSNSILAKWIEKLQTANEKEIEVYKATFSALTDEDFLSSLDEEQREVIQNVSGDTETLLRAYSLLKDMAGETADEIRDKLNESIAANGDIIETAQGKLNEYTNQLNTLKTAATEGVSSEELNNLKIEYGITADDIESYDIMTGKYILSEEAALRLAKAKEEEELATIDASIATEQESLAKAQNRLETVEVALKALENAEAHKNGAKAAYSMAQAVHIMNEQLGIETPALAEDTDFTLDYTNAIIDLKEQLTTEKESLEDAITAHQENIKELQLQRKATLGSANATNLSAKSTGKATDAAKAYADALKEQAEALKAATEAEQKRIETEVEGIKKVLEARKKALEEQNEAIQKQIDKEKEAQEILLEAYLKYLEKRKDEYQQTLDDMEKAAEKAREAADESNENLTFQNQIAQDYYKDQIELIDEKINALNKEAEAEDRLQKLQEARDAYERAKNTKNRLVLVRGAGWVFKRDQEEISSTYDALRDAEREVEIAKLNEEKELLQDQADAWAEKAENIGKTTEELEKYNKAYKEFANMTEEQRKEALNAFIDAVIRNNQLNQDATDKENAFEDQSDAEKEGTLAWNIAKVEELSEQTSELIDKIGKSAEELIKDNKINQVVDSLDSLLGEKGIEGLVSHLDTLTHGVNSYIDNFLKLSEQMTQNESAVEAIDKALEDWDELTENLGKSQSELNKELQLFNYYNQMTIEQLSKDSAVYNDIANQVSNLADQWERVNAAQAAYEAAQARADAISKASKNGEGYATGGVNTYTGLAAVHGTKSRPEVFLNNSQAGALFKFIDGLTRMPTLNKRNTPQNVVASTSKTEDNSTNYTNCKFEVVSNEDSIDGLLQDVKNRSPLRKF